MLFVAFINLYDKTVPKLYVYVVTLKRSDYRIYPRIGRTFFKEQNVRNLGCGLYAGTRVLNSLICKISRHTQSQQRYWKLDSLIECIIWGQVNPCLRRILLLSAAMSVSIVASEYVCYWMKSKEVCMSSHEAPSMPFTWNRICLQKYLPNYTKNTLNPSQKEKVMNETDMKYHSFKV